MRGRAGRRNGVPGSKRTDAAGGRHTGPPPTSTRLSWYLNRAALPPLQLATLPAHPESVPINALVAVKGTPMQDNEAPTGEHAWRGRHSALGRPSILSRAHPLVACCMTTRNAGPHLPLFQSWAPSPCACTSAAWTSAPHGLAAGSTRLHPSRGPAPAPT